LTSRLCAIAVALAATVLTPPASAQLDAPPSLRPDPPAAASEGPTPLALRPNKSLELAREPEHATAGWKVVAVLAVLGGAAFYLRKRWKPRRGEDGQLTIVRRAAIGMRSELLIVNVEGQRMLLGVTPHSIQTLAMLDALEATSPVGSEQARSVLSPAEDDAAFDIERGVLGSANAAAAATSRGAASDGPGRTPDLGGRFAAMLRAADPGARPPPATPGEGIDDTHVAGQARGLLALRRRG
jgi:flagellar biogenesis protein FliO